MTADPRTVAAAVATVLTGPPDSPWWVLNLPPAPNDRTAGGWVNAAEQHLDEHGQEQLFASLVGFSDKPNAWQGALLFHEVAPVAVVTFDGHIHHQGHAHAVPLGGTMLDAVADALGYLAHNVAIPRPL